MDHMQNPLVLAGQADSPLKIPEELKKLLGMKTPPQFIEARKGPGGKMLDYVEVGYMRRMLDESFGIYWSENTQELTHPVQALEMRQVLTKTTITVKIPLFNSDKQMTGEFFTIERVGYGGKDIVAWNGKVPQDLGNDFKGARADSFKKAVAQFGIAADVYEPNVQDKVDAAVAKREAKQRAAAEKGEPTLDGKDYIEKGTQVAITEAYRNAGLSDDDVQNYVKVKFKTDSLKKLTQEQADVLLEWIGDAAKKKK